MLPLDGHQVDAVDPLHLLEFLDLLAGDVDAFLGDLALFDTLQAVDDLFRDIHAGHLGCHIPGHTDALHRRDTAKDIDFFGEAFFIGHADEFTEFRHVVDTLRLDEIGAGFDLLGQAVDAPDKRFGEGIAGRADEHFRRLVDLVAA